MNSVKWFRALLKDYLTDPPYATVRELNPNQLVVQIPNGGGCFLVAIFVQENQTTDEL